MVRHRRATSLALGAGILVSGWTVGAAACDQRAAVGHSDRASDLRLEQLLLKHRPHLVVPKTATGPAGR